VDAALGQRAVTVSLVNCGSDHYAVEGYPAVELLDEQQQPIDVALEQEPDPLGNGTTEAPVALDLAPGEHARAVLAWRNTVELGSVPTPGSFVAVTPVAGEAGQVVALAVDLGTTGRLTVGPWGAPA
jgi:hypothetical protein